MELTAIAEKAGDETIFPIDETFQRTIQGEGFWTGTLCDFIRLSGCPVGCFFCDTGYSEVKSKTNSRKTIKELLSEIVSRRVVITGGEPLIHKKIGVLVSKLIKKGHQVSIETSGAFEAKIPEEAWITLSPKAHVSPGYPVNPSTWDRANEIKIVISDGTEVDYYKRLFRVDEKLCYLQPEHSNLAETLPIALKLLQENEDMTLSLQTHKFIGVR